MSRNGDSITRRALPDLYSQVSQQARTRAMWHQLCSIFIKISLTHATFRMSKANKAMDVVQ